MTKPRRRSLLAAIVFFAVLGIWGAGCLGPKLSTIRVGGTERGYLLHLPTAFDTAKTYPLVLALHQFSDTPAGTETLSGFSDLADKEGWLRCLNA